MSLTAHQCDRLSAILADEYDQNPAFRAAVDDYASRAVPGTSRNPTSAGDSLSLAGLPAPTGGPAISK